MKRPHARWAGRAQEALELRWEPPDFDGGASLSGYRLDMAQVGSILEDAVESASTNGKVSAAMTGQMATISVVRDRSQGSTVAGHTIGRQRDLDSSRAAIVNRVAIDRGLMGGGGWRTS